MGCSCSKPAEQAVSQPRCESGSALPRVLDGVLQKKTDKTEQSQPISPQTDETYKEEAGTHTTCKTSCTSHPSNCECCESWQSDLRHISNELKYKLQDPHFVATCCDLDGSGDLDMHELKQAAEVFGVRIRWNNPRDQERLQQLMSAELGQLGQDDHHQLRISARRFAEIVADFPGAEDSSQSQRSLGLR